MVGSRPVRVLIAITIVSLFVSGLNLGIDFEGGVSWEVPSSTLTIDQARTVLEDSGIAVDNVKIVERTSTAGRNLLITASDQPLDKQQEVRIALAEAAGVEEQAVSSSSVSSTWGASITKKAIRALVVFLVLVAIFIAWRFEWRMAVAAIVAMVHDVLISVGVYSVFGFEVTPATVVGVPDDPRLLAVRHHRRVRQGQGERVAVLVEPRARTPTS